MPGWYVIVELTNKNISDITQQFSAWGGVYGSILVGFTMLYMLTIVLLEKKDKKMYMGLSTTDSLTGIDVDNFKIYNDTYGHNNGDFCLKYFAKTMKSCFPEDSIIGRYGGDEFVVYLKNSTGEMARTYMEKFQRMISHLTLPTGEDIGLSASAGGAAFPEQGEDVMSLCRNADTALYKVKQNGKADFKMKGM